MWYTWTRIFASRLFADIRFPTDVRFCEDLMTMGRLYPRVESINNLPVALYYYRVNPAGATLDARPDHVNQLTRYYLSILDEHGDCADLQKMSIQFCIYSCQQNMGLPYAMDPRLSRDLQRIRRRLSLYRYIPFRRMRILWLPEFSRWLTRAFGRDTRR